MNSWCIKLYKILNKIILSIMKKIICKLQMNISYI